MVSRLFVVLSLVAWPYFAAGSSESDAAIDITWTSITPFGPEVHVRIQNKTSESKRFSFGIVPGLEGETYCMGGKIPRHSSINRRFRRGHRQQDGSYVGTIHAGAWMHEVLALGLYEGEPPCKVVVAGMVGDRKFSREVSIKSEAFYPIRSASVAPMLEIVSGVSKIFDTADYAVKTYVKNQGESLAYVFVMDRRLNCPQARQARWATYKGYMQGLDFGPITLEPGCWIVFSNLIKTYNGVPSASRCSGDITIGMLDSDYEPYAVENSTFSLSDIAAAYGSMVPTK